MDKSAIIKWLLDGDVSVQYQTRRDLLGEPAEKLEKLRARIVKEGWGARYLAAQDDSGMWGRDFYQPKWTNAHYTLMDLRNLELPPDNAQVRKTIGRIFAEARAEDGSINYAHTVKDSDVCLNGSILNFASYFGVSIKDLLPLVEYLLKVRMGDFGWNCDHVYGATHSSLHTTIAVLEGFLEFRRKAEPKSAAVTKALTRRISEAEASGREFILRHRLFKSHRTGAVIDKKMLMLSWPSRWKYDILRCLDYFRIAGVSCDERMADAFEVLIKKRRKDGTWPLQHKHPGAVHFDMEETGKPSRWNTLRAMRVLRYFNRPPRAFSTS